MKIYRKRLIPVLAPLLLTAWPADLAGQERLNEGETFTAEEDGFFLTNSQFQDMAFAVDSLVYWKQVAQVEESQKERWKGLYSRLDSLYMERDEVEVERGFGLRDAGFWTLMGAAGAIVIEGVWGDG